MEESFEEFMKMTFHTPTTPFNNIVPEEGTDRVLRAVQRLTEDQAKYMLWSLVLMAGNDFCNLSQVLQAHADNQDEMPKKKNSLRLREGLTLAAQFVLVDYHNA